MTNKCWKKIKPIGNRPDNSVTWSKNGKNFEYVSVLPNMRNMSGKVFDYSVETRFIEKRFKSKSKAIGYAKKYMGENNKC